MIVTFDDVSKAVQMLGKSKSAGPDGIAGEHFIHAHHALYFHIAILFTAILRYTVIPDRFLDVVLIPLVKDKCGDLASKDNYRPIALSNIISKIFERIILWRCEEYLLTTQNQFAFKPKLSTELCI